MVVNKKRKVQRFCGCYRGENNEVHDEKNNIA